MKLSVRTAAAVVALTVGASSVAFANDELMVMQNNPAELGDAERQLSQHALQHALPDQHGATSAICRSPGRFSTGVLRGHEGGPLVIGDVDVRPHAVPQHVYALDLNDDGRVIWKYEPKQDPNVIPVMCCDTVNRGVAYGDGKIFLHQADTTLVALDAKTGKVVWQVKNGDPTKGETGTSAPLVVQGQGLSSASRAASSACTAA